MQQLRRLWLRVHRWVALGIGWVLILSGLTGAVLVAARPLDRWLHPGLFVAEAPMGAGISAAQAPATLDSVVRRMRAKFGPKASFTLRPPRQADDTLWVLLAMMGVTGVWLWWRRREVRRAG